ncbi:hypothetical protein MANAM107_25880 [Actinomyces capricornis]|uniref:Uncharacterized protein n=1 Tax=Actinomyces capricornis TaxID=2755559 RepID=A0ABM7UEZ7_9ACTO|nr:hypothetical protein MANAM107_25880 [Actinomyces capricornis]
MSRVRWVTDAPVGWAPRKQGSGAIRRVGERSHLRADGWCGGLVPRGPTAGALSTGRRARARKDGVNK